MCCRGAETAALCGCYRPFNLQKVNLAVLSAIRVLLLSCHPRKQIWERTIWYLVLGNTAIRFSYLLENVDQSIPCTNISSDEVTGHVTGAFIIFA